MSNAIDRLAREIHSLKRQIKAMSTPQLSHSSVVLWDGSESSVTEGIETAQTAAVEAEQAGQAASEAATAAAAAQAAGDAAAVAAAAADAAAADAQAAADAVALEVDGIPAQIATAKDEAVLTAEQDAQNKADLAEAQAIAAATAQAATTAQEKADAAEAAAISAAAADAAAKDAAAKAATLTEAATTAQQKADAAAATAKAEALAAAAVDAQDKADLAEATAINAAKDYSQARGTDLITNGTGVMGDATNFATWFTFNGADAPVGANGSFVDKFTTAHSAMTDEVQPYDPNKKLRLSFQCRQTVAGGAGKMYAFLSPFDVAGNSIAPSNYIRIAGTETTLAADLKPGDTVVYLTDVTESWFGTAAKPAIGTYQRAIQFWDYTDSMGKAWPAYSYTRNVTASDIFADGAVDPVANTITLRAPYSGPTHLAGTAVSQSTSGGSYIYMPSATNVLPPETWTSYADTHPGGIFPSASQAVATTGGATWGQGMPPGTASVRVGWLLNYAPGGGRHAVALVSLSDSAAASHAAYNITETQITTDAITSPKIKAGAVIAGKLATDSVLANNIKAGEVTAGKLAANSVVASNIAAEAVTASKLFVGDMSNMATIDADPVGAGYAMTYEGGFTGSDGKSNWIRRSAGTPNQYFMFRRQVGPVPIKAGDRIRMTFEGYVYPGNVTFGANVWLYGGTGGTVSFGLTAVPNSPALTMTAAPQTFVMEGVAPTTVTDQTSFIIGINAAGFTTAEPRVRNVRAHRMGAGELIVDGGIVSQHIKAENILASHIKANDITAAQIKAGTITSASGVVGDLSADHIKAGTLDASLVNVTKLNASNIYTGTLSGARLAADAIDGKTITGATFQTEATANRGIKWTTAGINAYSPAGVNTVNIDAATGNLTAIGDFKTAASGARAELIKDLYQGSTTHQLRFYPTVIDPGMDPAMIYANGNAMSEGYRTSKIGIIAGNKTDASGTWTSLDVGTENLFLSAFGPMGNPHAQIQMRATDALIEMSGDVRIEGRRMRDTGWIPLTRNNTAAHSIGGGVVPAVRVIDDVAYLRGNISSFASGSFLQIATLDTPYRPSATANYPASANSATAFSIQVNATNGAVSVYCSATTSAWLSLTGAQYPLG